MVEGHPEWRARVVYGDTDSLFVLLPGRSREEAFRIGQEIAAAATAANPPPVTLKMEKVCSSEGAARQCRKTDVSSLKASLVELGLEAASWMPASSSTGQRP